MSLILFFFCHLLYNDSFTVCCIENNQRELTGQLSDANSKQFELKFHFPCFHSARSNQMPNCSIVCYSSNVSLSMFIPFSLSLSLLIGWKPLFSLIERNLLPNECNENSYFQCIPFINLSLSLTISKMIDLWDLRFTSH